MPSHYRIGDARLVDGAWEGWANEWVPLDRFPMPAWAVQISVNPTTAQVIFQDEADGRSRDVARNPIRQSEQPTEGTIRTLPDGSVEVYEGGKWADSESASGTFVPKEEGETPEERAERERNLVEAAREIIRSETGREPTESEDQQIQRILLAGEDVLREARRLAALGAVPGGYETEEVLTGPEAMALGAVEGQRVIVTRNPDGSIRNIDLQDAPDRFAEVNEALEAERRLVEARRATDIAQKSRSVDQQFAAALDAGDLDKARLIRNFKDEPSEWQIELLKMEYADNLPALKILFDYVDAIGRADVVPEDARALVEPTPPQPATPSERQKMVDPVGWAAAQPPGTFQTQGPPGFGGETPAFVGAEVFPDTPAAALRRGDPNLFIHGGEQIGAEGAVDRTFRGPVGPVPSTRRLSATDMASPLFQSSLQTAKGTADEPVVHLLVDGIHTPVLASQYAGFVRQATSLGRTVEVPNRETGVFDTVSVGADGSIQSRPTVEDDGSVRFGPTGERFVTEKTLTADQVTDPLFQQAVGAGGVQPLAPFSLSQAEAGRPEGLPFTVTQETMDKIQRARDIDLSRSEPDYGSVTFVKPGGLSAEERRSLTDTVTAEIETSARNSRNRAFYLREQARNYPVSFPMTTIGSPPRTYSYGDQLLQEADELEARAAEREKNAATEIRERLAEASKGQMGSSSWSTEADIEEFMKQRPGWVEAYRTDPLPVAEPVFGPSREEREATFIKEAQAFAPEKKTPKPFGPPRFVTT